MVAGGTPSKKETVGEKEVSESVPRDASLVQLTRCGTSTFLTSMTISSQAMNPLKLFHGSWVVGGRTCGLALSQKTPLAKGNNSLRRAACEANSTSTGRSPRRLTRPAWEDVRCFSAHLMASSMEWNSTNASIVLEVARSIMIWMGSSESGSTREFRPRKATTSVRLVEKGI